MLQTFKVVAVLWEDHTVFRNSKLPPSEEILPSLTVGVLYQEDERTLTILSHLERYADGDVGDYSVIFKHSVIGKPKEYGEIELSL